MELKIRILGKLENRKITRGGITGNKKKMKGGGGGLGLRGSRGGGNKFSRPLVGKKSGALVGVLLMGDSLNSKKNKEKQSGPIHG